MRPTYIKWLKENGLLFIVAAIPLISSLLSAEEIPCSEDIHAKGYFGEPLGGLADEQREAFDKGFQLFVRNWSLQAGAPANAVSCVTCHSVPAPGGSGMSIDALVAVKLESGKTRITHSKSEIDSVVRRRTPSLMGIGLIENAQILRENGAVRPIFGALAERATLNSVIAHAFASELGISSTKECATATKSPKDDNCIINISDSDLDDVVSFVRYLAAPPKHAVDTHGEMLFQSVGCVTCHVPSFRTRPDAAPPLRGRLVAAYTDLQLHDLGVGIKIRTTALWGVSSFGPPYMHNGKGDSILGRLNFMEVKPSPQEHNFFP